jgi:hypothetical protein
MTQLASVKTSAATLGRQSSQQGGWSQEKHPELNHQMSQPEGRAPKDADLQLKRPSEPFTLMIELNV